MEMSLKSMAAAVGKVGVGLASVLMVACNSGNKNAETDLKKLEWLVGTWQQTSEAGNFTETWSQNGSGLTGKGYLLDNHDTIFSESLKIENRNGTVFYVPLIAGQNKGEEVTFKLISSANGKFVFENKQHDFPQRIIYRQLAGDSLFARVEGEVKGKLQAEDFKMKRVK